MNVANVGSIIFAALVACSSSSVTNNIGSRADDGGTANCSVIPSQHAFDAASSCFDSTAQDVEGVCRTPAVGTPTTGLESVCAVKNGSLFLLEMSTDQILSGDGWTFGPRAAPDVVHQTSTLSASDVKRCIAAGDTPASELCAADAGETD